MLLSKQANRSRIQRFAVGPNSRHLSRQSHIAFIALAMDRLKIAVFPIAPYIESCVLDLSELRPTKRCPQLGLGAEVLGMALEMARLPYSLVKLPNYNASSDGGVFDEQSGNWSGGLLNEIGHVLIFIRSNDCNTMVYIVLPCHKSSKSTRGEYKIVNRW